MGEARPVRALLRDRVLGPFLVGNLISNAGNWFQVVGSVLLVYELTGSARMVSLVSVSTFGMFLLLSPVAGAVTDRVDRRRLLMTAQVVASLASASLAVLVALGLASVVPVLLLTAVLGVTQVFTLPALLALVPALVPPRDLTAAIGLNTVVVNVARVLGPASAAVVISRVGVAPAFAVNALSFLVLTAILLRWVRPLHTVEPEGAPDRSIRAGMRFAWRDRATLCLLVGVAATGVAMDPTSTLAPPLADLHGGGDQLVGYFVASFGAGAIVSSLLVPRVSGILPWRPELAGLAVCAMGLVGLAASPNGLAAMVFYGLLGGGYLVGLTELTTRIQVRVPEALRGRVMGLWSQVLLGSRPAAAVVAGWIADAHSPRLAALALTVAPLVALAVVRRARSASLDPVSATS